MPNDTSYHSTAAEAARIFRAVFGREAPPIVVERFVAASDRLNAMFADDKVSDYYDALERVGDLEALEVACRYWGAIPMLSEKFRIMVYVAETTPELQPEFVNHDSSMAAALWALFGGALRTGYKLAKGFFLIGRARNA